MKNTTLVFFLTLILIVFGNFSSVDAKKTAPPKKDAVFAVMDPRGVQPSGDLVPLAPRVQDLSNKTVYIIRSWPDASSGLEETFGKVARTIKDRFPTATVVIKTRNTHYDLDDPQLWKEMKENKVAAFIYGVAPSSSTTAYAFKYSAKLEKDGIPGTVLMFDSLTSVAQETRKRVGASVRYTAVSYPETALTEKQLSEAMNSIIKNLTSSLSEGCFPVGDSSVPHRCSDPFSGFLGNRSKGIKHQDCPRYAIFLQLCGIFESVGGGGA